MTLKANTTAGLKWAAVLMTASMLLLLCFLGYWLNSQYADEKRTLQKELLTDLTNTQREITDSIMFERFAGPLFAAEKGDTTGLPRIFKNVKTTPGVGESTITIYNGKAQPALVDSLKKAMSKGLDSLDKAYTKVKVSNSYNIGTEEHSIVMSIDGDDENNIRKITDKSLMKINDSSEFPSDSAVLNAIGGLLRTAMKLSLKDTLSKLNVRMEPADIALVHNEFAKGLTIRNKKLKAIWISDSANNKEGANNKLLVAYNIYDNKGKVAITGYNGYLMQKVLPQFLFAVLLIVFVSMAFIVTYRNLNRQIKLSDMKNGLISNMSHELKTPVATVKVALEALDDYGIINNPAQAREYIHMAKLETQRLEMLINKALNTSLLEQGKISLQTELTDVSVLTSDIIQSLKLRLQQHNTTINLQTEGDNFTLNIDKLHIQGAILNIIDNSIKYGKPPVIINIDIIAQDATVTVNITDNGPGIPDEYAEQVFDKFFRVPTGDKHNVQGYGLGLSYVKQVMQLHGGMVQLRNIPEGGCRFTLQFFRGR